MRLFYEFICNICFLCKYILKGKKGYKKGNFLKKIFLFIFIDIFLVYFKKFDFDFKVIS